MHKTKSPAEPVLVFLLILFFDLYGIETVLCPKLSGVPFKMVSD